MGVSSDGGRDLYQRVTPSRFERDAVSNRGRSDGVELSRRENGTVVTKQVEPEVVLQGAAAGEGIEQRRAARHSRRRLVEEEKIGISRGGTSWRE